MKSVIWGVLSTAKIGTQKVIPGMQKSDWCNVRAIASRSIASAREAGNVLGIPKAYGSYDELLADPEIEAIYNPLPNHLHVPDHQGRRSGQACVVRKADRPDCRRGPTPTRGERQSAYHGSIHGAVPSTMAARPRSGSSGQIGTPRAVQVFSLTSTPTRAISAIWPRSAAVPL